MNKYVAIYEDRNGEIVSIAEFKGENIKEAKTWAQLHKSRTPEIQKAKGVKTTVRRKKA
jgi:hypothetical protein